ncbi:MAG: DNA gyrase inhibitor YacG [Acidobacteria bacterium]|nr:DNA gyrase inhibitor YacG [Acidobacteriota bacterium]
MSAIRLCVCCRKRPVDAAWRPSCNERCKLIDLGRWLDGNYWVTGERMKANDAPS